LVFAVNAALAPTNRGTSAASCPRFADAFGHVFPCLAACCHTVVLRQRIEFAIDLLFPSSQPIDPGEVAGLRCSRDLNKFRRQNATIPEDPSPVGSD
jgi:hypothetical protein